MGVTKIIRDDYGFDSNDDNELNPKILNFQQELFLDELGW